VILRLSYVQIRNFRSIADVKISFDPTCRILVGINETGKSNILMALALLDPEREPAPADLRDFRPDEDPNQAADVRFIFILDKDERTANYEEGLSRVLVADAAAPVLRRGGVEMTLEQVFDIRSEGLFTVNLRTGKKSATVWRLDPSFKAITGWKKPSAACPPNFNIQTSDGASALREFALIEGQAIADREIPSEYLEDIDAEDVNTLIQEHVSEHIEAHLPPCVFWSYSEENLLPGQIDLKAFSAKPAICAPLKHMFELADIPNISGAFLEADKRPNGLRNLLNRVADRATKHMHSVWKEHRAIRIELAPNGPHIDASVKDEYNLYDFSRRSDGFKRFVTFLLMVSARVRSAQLIDTLYLHDEPDLSLHPSGARYLRDELIKIAKRNYVVFSTHSIFMVDRELLRRHLIVEKKAEATLIREVDDSNIVDEEVIYNALSYSVFENLQANNIIFEGWRDKRLFQVALKNMPSKHKGLKSVLSDLGVCHAKGVKDIGRITPMLELAGRSWIVLSDGDNVAVEHQNRYDGEGQWYRYDELLPDETAVTGEDFVKVEAFRPMLRRLTSEHPSLSELSPDALRTAEPKINTIKTWLHRGGIGVDDVKPILETLKEQLFLELKPSHIEDKYYDLLVQISSKLKPPQA
jgi:hypothetical protein